MKIGIFGYPGDSLARVKAMTDALKARGAQSIVCLGGLISGGVENDEDADPPATVLRWLRSSEIRVLGNDTDRQVAGWRLQALENTTGYIRPRVRKFLSAVTREEAQWIFSLRSNLPMENMLFCADNLTIDALFPVPLSSFNAGKLFSVMEQKAAFFPSANGPTLLVRKQEDGVIEGGKLGDIEERLDSPRQAMIVGGVVGYPPLNADVSWGALVDSDALRVALICLNAKDYQSVPEQGRLLIQRAESHWRE